MMLYQVRRDGKYFLRPINIDESGEWTISREEFFARWERCGGNADDIKKAKSHNGDIDVL